MPMPRTSAAPTRRATALVLVAIILGAGACGLTKKVYDPTRWVYEKKDATPAKLDRDMTACRKESIDLNKLAPTSSQRIDRDKFNRCMERHGYTARPEED